MNHSLYSNIDYIITYTYLEIIKKKIDNKSRIDEKGFQMSRIRHRLRIGVSARLARSRARVVERARRARVVASDAHVWWRAIGDGDARRQSRRRRERVRFAQRGANFSVTDFLLRATGVTRAPFKYTAESAPVCDTSRDQL